MGIQHKAFNCKLIILSVFIIFLTLANVSRAQAQNNVFVVDNILVDVTAKDSVAAQEQAYARAQSIAFEKLKRRLVDDAQLEKFPEPSFDQVASLVQDYEIINEKISSVRYVGTYRFRFSPEVVKKYFFGAGVSYTTQASKPLLILPIYQENGVNMLWAEDNLWMQAWGRTRLTGGLVPVEVPLGDLTDITDIDDRNPLRYERSKLDNMLDRYNASEAAIMIAVPDETLLSVEDSDEVAIGRLRIIIYRTDRARAEYVGEFTLASEQQETRAALYTRAVQKAYGALQRDWKKHNASSAQQTARYVLRIPVHNLAQWVDVKDKLLSLPAISNLEQESIMRNEVQVSFNYRGDANLLAQNLKSKRLTLSAPQNLQVNPQAALNTNVFDLYTHETMPANISPQAGGDLSQAPIQRF